MDRKHCGLLWGALLLLLLAVCFACRQPASIGSVEFSEVVSDNERSYVEEGRGLHDWIELHNTGSSSVSLNGWYITDRYSSLNTAKSLPNIELPPDGYCVFYADKAYTGTDYFCLPFGISRQGETLYLFDSSGELMSTLQVPSLEKDVSWAKGLDGEFAFCLEPTPGKANTTDLVQHIPDSMKKQSGVKERSPIRLYINEVSSVSTKSDPDWIELYNPNDTSVDLTGFSLSDSDSNPQKGILGELSIPAKGYLVLLCDRDADPSTGISAFSISSGGERLSMWDDQGLLIDVVDVPMLRAGIVYARTDDGGYGYCMTPTPGAANETQILPELPVQAEKIENSMPIRINEVDSSSLDGLPDWFELMNYGEQDLVTRGLYISDSYRNLSKCPLPEVTIPAGGYYVFFCGEGVDAATGVPEINISSKGESLFLSDDDETVIDSVRIPALHRGIVYARDQEGAFGYSGQPTPGEKNSQYVHAEELHPMGQSDPVRLSEGLFKNRYSGIDAYGDHSDWIELVNGGDTAVSLDGYFLSDRTDDLQKWAFPAIELGPKEFLVVFLSGKESFGKELHASFSVSDSDDGCVLYDSKALSYEVLPCPRDLKDNVSIGLDENGELIYFNYPTPGYANAHGFSAQQASAFPNAEVYISEVSAGGQNGEWIELHNRGETTVDLVGWHLSDDDKDSLKCPLGQISLSAGAYYTVFLKKKGVEPFFSISMSGEDIVLTDPDGSVRDVYATGALKSGLSSGRITDDDTLRRVFFTNPTEGKANAAEYLEGYAPKPVLSDTSLYHTAPFRLTIQTTDPSAVIYFTLDGTAPNRSSSVYSGPIEIKRNTCVRVIAEVESRLTSEEAYANYLFGPRHTLPVVCIGMDPKHWDAMKKVPGVKAGLEEQAACVSYYEKDGAIGVAFHAGVSPRGNTSIRYPQKSMSIHLRSQYGEKQVVYPFWGEGSALAYQFLILRNGSQDWQEARLRDSFADRAAANLRVMTPKTRPVIVYVDGEYYGLMDMNEGMNHDYLWTHYQVDTDTVNIVLQNDVQKRGKKDGYLALRKFAARKDLSKAENYDAFSKMVDMDAIIDYLIAQSFFGNYDISNQAWWGTSDGRIKWQPYLYDVDRCLHERSYGTNVLQLYFSKNGAKFGEFGDRKIHMEIYCGLHANKAWRKRVAERYAELLCTDFSEARLSALLDQMAEEMLPEMEKHIALWGKPSSVQRWKSEIKLMHQLISKRYEYIIPRVKNIFDISDAEWDAMIAKYQQ